MFIFTSHFQTTGPFALTFEQGYSHAKQLLPMNFIEIGEGVQPLLGATTFNGEVEFWERSGNCLIHLSANL